MRRTQQNPTTTGATPEQIEAGIDRSLTALKQDCGIDGPREDQETLIGLAACMLVPPDHRILGPEQIAALGRVLGGFQLLMTEYGIEPTRYLGLPEDLAILAAIIGGEG